MKRNHVSSYDFVEHTVHVHRKKAQSYIVCNFPGALRSGYLHCTLLFAAPEVGISLPSYVQEHQAHEREPPPSYDDCI